ncbi:MAG: hypothetical protein D6767_06635 [Candidatus Hydrogenedentota bacterium]|nr:MAG: hypothetical protein D6767_06635 [Candidatus Hydrogenedentota bacterium]
MRKLFGLLILIPFFCGKPKIPPVPSGASVSPYSEVEEPEKEKETVKKFQATIETARLKGVIETSVFPSSQEAKTYFMKIKPEKPVYQQKRKKRFVVVSETSVFVYSGKRVDVYIFYPEQNSFWKLNPVEKQKFSFAVLQFAKKLISSFSS